MKTWYEKAGEAYLAGTPDVSWSELVEAHFRTEGAYVISSPWFFVMGRMVDQFSSDEDLLDLERMEVDRLGGAFHVEAFAGHWRNALAELPASVSVVTFQRRGMKVHRREVWKMRFRRGLR